MYNSSIYEAQQHLIKTVGVKPNILIFGGSGVGKSTLIKRIIGQSKCVKESCKISVCTIEVEKWNGYGVQFIEYPGFTQKDSEVSIIQVFDYISQCNQKSYENHIHMVWFILDSSTARVLSLDKQLYDRFEKISIPNHTIFTKCDQIDEVSITNMLMELDSNCAFETCFTSSDSPFFTTSDGTITAKKSSFEICNIFKNTMLTIPLSLHKIYNLYQSKETFEVHLFIQKEVQLFVEQMEEKIRNTSDSFSNLYFIPLGEVESQQKIEYIQLIKSFTNHIVSLLLDLYKLNVIPNIESSVRGILDAYIERGNLLEELTSGICRLHVTLDALLESFFNISKNHRLINKNELQYLLNNFDKTFDDMVKNKYKKYLKGSINILMAGKSGVGKSSLINYLKKDEVAMTGSGSAQTKRGVEKYHINYDGDEYCFHDTWGIEPGNNSVKWFDDFRKHCSSETQGRNYKTWMHAVIYCVSGSGGRIEKVEIETIQRIKQEYSMQPIVVLTKADADKDGKLASWIAKETGLHVLSVCAVQKSMGLGKSKRVIEPFGEEELIASIKEQSLLLFHDRVKKIIDDDYKNALIGIVNNLPTLYEKKMRKFSLMGYVKKENAENVSKSIVDYLENKEKELETKVTQWVEDIKISYPFLLGDLKVKSTSKNGFNVGQSRSFINGSDLLGIGILEAVTFFLGAGGLFFLGKKLFPGNIDVDKSVSQMQLRCAELIEEIEKCDSLLELKNSYEVTTV
ncbi:GTPase domain-containing protein [Halosquirtibacter laminarini]|uniref:GTPase domain-containing protein n=1 Tax=Halosquirtibacter laminarini TaxID=3374600 RepID=A0AC61NHU8_9BACT|nr:GTPase domain-containing protein [Prolixibacteraceae bacterium]